MAQHTSPHKTMFSSSLLLLLLCVSVLLTGCLRVEVPDGQPTNGAAGLPPPDFIQPPAPKNDLNMKAIDTSALNPETVIISNSDSNANSDTKTPAVVVDTKPYLYEFNGIESWINLEEGKTSLTRKELKGKVVLVDFWTYSCINCIRTLPHTTGWDAAYRDKGLVVVGVHSPEFAFEHERANVEDAVKRYGVNYPVGLDNNFVTWRTYDNNYWPHIYLFNRDGDLVFDHIGEGGDAVIESKIQELLGEEYVDNSFTLQPTPSFSQIRTPEIYLGGASSRGHTGYALAQGTSEFTLPAQSGRVDNTVYLGGTWNVESERLTAEKNATLLLRYSSKDVYLVAGGKGLIKPIIDGAEQENVVVDGERLYTVASTAYAEQEILLKVSDGISLYAFTFG